MHRTAMKWLTISAVLGGLTGAVLISVSCGGDNSARPTGSGGANGSGGATGGAAGTTAGTGGGAVGSGGATLSCQTPLAPASGTVTTFTSGTDWNQPNGKFGTSGNIFGSTYAYKGADTDTMSKNVDTTAGNYRIWGTIQPGSYGGGGLSFEVCSTIVGFNAIEFKLSGTGGGCDLELQLQNYSQKGTSAGGGCASGSSCWAFPTKKNVPIDSAATTVTIPFADMTNWSTAAGSEIVGIQWQFTVPPPADPDGGVQTACSPDVRIDDVKFITQ